VFAVCIVGGVAGYMARAAAPLGEHGGRRLLVALIGLAARQRATLRPELPGDRRRARFGRGSAPGRPTAASSVMSSSAPPDTTASPVPVQGSAGTA
jgi:hypothetical protein